MAEDAPLWAGRCSLYGTVFWRGGGRPLPFKIQDAIYEAFGVLVVSENDYRYEGFETQEQYEVALNASHSGELP